MVLGGLSRRFKPENKPFFIRDVLLLEVSVLLWLGSISRGRTCASFRLLYTILFSMLTVLKSQANPCIAAHRQLLNGRFPRPSRVRSLRGSRSSSSSRGWRQSQWPQLLMGQGWHSGGLNLLAPQAPTLLCSNMLLCLLATLPNLSPPLNL